MIMARQMSKPVADVVMRYGKTHPFFRDRMLVPVGRGEVADVVFDPLGIVNLTTRLRMSRLGLGKPDALAPVSEAAALEQASEFVQQVVIFGYSVGVFAAYNMYSKANEKEVVSAEDYRARLLDFEQRFSQLDRKLDRLTQELEKRNQVSWAETHQPSSQSYVGAVKSRLFRSQSTGQLPKEEAAQVRPLVTSSIPFEEALQKVMPVKPAVAKVKVVVQTPEDQSD